MYALAAATALAIAFAPGTASSGAFTTDGPKQSGPRWSNDRHHERGYAGPRWSNDHHHERGLIVGPDCVALPPGADAEYVAGVDPWGHPVVPAEAPKGFRDPFPVGVDLDVKLDSKHIAGKEIEMHAGRFTFDPATNELSLNGRRWQRDCLSSPK